VRSCSLERGRYHTPIPYIRCHDPNSIPALSVRDEYVMIGRSPLRLCRLHPPSFHFGEDLWVDTHSVRALKVSTTKICMGLLTLILRTGCVSRTHAAIRGDLGLSFACPLTPFNFLGQLSLPSPCGVCWHKPTLQLHGGPFDQFFKLF